MNKTNLGDNVEADSVTGVNLALCGGDEHVVDHVHSLEHILIFIFSPKKNKKDILSLGLSKDGWRF